MNTENNNNEKDEKESVSGAGKSWLEHYEAGQNFYDEKDRIYMKICSHHRAGTENNFQSLVYNNIRLVNGILYFAFHTGANNAHEMTDAQLGGLLWKNTISSIRSPKRRKASSRSDFYPDADNLGNLFVQTFCTRYNLDQSDEKLMRDVRYRYVCYLANQMNGVIAEKRTYVNLAARLGPDRVRWAEASEEKTDVDLYIDGLPVSVKNYYCFSVKHFRKYREEKGCTKPVLYINEHLHTAIPVSDEKGGWRYEFHTPDELESVIEKLAGKSNVDDIDDDDFNLDIDSPF